MRNSTMFTYSEYELDSEKKGVLFEQVKILYDNLKPKALNNGNACNTEAEQT